MAARYGEGEAGATIRGPCLAPSASDEMAEWPEGENIMTDKVRAYLDGGSSDPEVEITIDASDLGRDLTYMQIDREDWGTLAGLLLSREQAIDLIAALQRRLGADKCPERTHVMACRDCGIQLDEFGLVDHLPGEPDEHYAGCKARFRVTGIDLATQQIQAVPGRATRYGMARDECKQRIAASGGRVRWMVETA